MSGRVSGVALSGTTYVEFAADGSVSGYALVKKSDERYSLTGSWTLIGKKVFGSLTVTSESGSYSAVLDLSGSASEGRSISIRAVGNGSDSFKFSGKPFVTLGDLSGRYQGLIRMRGLNGLLTVDLAAPDAETPGLYPITGEMFFPASGTDSLSGYAIVKRTGDFIAFVTNESTGYSASIWGKIKTRGPISCSGIDLSDGTSVRVKFFDTPFTS